MATIRLGACFVPSGINTGVVGELVDMLAVGVRGNGGVAADGGGMTVDAAKASASGSIANV